jgi:hypothetical protein
MEKIKFGPPLYKTKIRTELKDRLLLSAKNQIIPNNKNLAGRIDNEKLFDNESHKNFEGEIVFLVKDYLKFVIDEQLNTDITIDNIGFILESLWVNFQKCNEYNPPHAHGGDISFVIYLDIPDEIKNETPVGHSNANGSINFIYGNSTLSHKKENILVDLLQPKSLISHLPENGEMFIFPSYLMHYVESFISEDVERISVSGNITLYNKNSNKLI